MDLLTDDYGKNNKNNQSSKKKIVLIALIASVVLLVILLFVISSLSGSKPQKETLTVNGELKELTENLVLSDEMGNKYISIQELAKFINYEYYNGEYGKTTEDKNKCYLNNSDYIMGFEANSNKMYKTKMDSLIDVQEYKLNNNILQYNNSLYIAINDAGKALNIVASYAQDTKKIIINTCEYLTTTIQKTYDDNKSNIKLSTEVNNESAISYNMLVVSNNSKYGVVNATNREETIIGTKYDSLSFDEYTQSFIVSTGTNKYGVIGINSDGKVEGKIDLKYESIDIISYNPILYQVKQNSKYGVLDKDGKILVSLDYEKLGYTETNKTNINPALIIKNIKNSKDGIVVYQKGKYGVVSLSNGEIVFDNSLDAIYSKTENDEKKYYVLLNQKEYTLETYLQYINTLTVEVNQ